MEALATYREKQYDNKRTFELFPDRLVIRGSQTFGSDFDAEVPLAHLNPHYDRVRVRSPHFNSGMAIVGVCAFIIVFLTGGYHQPLLSEPVLILAIFGFCGLIVMAATYSELQTYAPIWYHTCDIHRRWRTPLVCCLHTRPSWLSDFPVARYCCSAPDHHCGDSVASAS